METGNETAARGAGANTEGLLDCLWIIATTQQFCYHTARSQGKVELLIPLLPEHLSPSRKSASRQGNISLFRYYRTRAAILLIQISSLHLLVQCFDERMESTELASCLDI